MSDVPFSEDGPETSFPPNARLTSIQFDDERKEMRVSLDGGEEHSVPAGSIIALHGSRLLRESMKFATEKKKGNPMVTMGLLAVGIPVNPLPKKSKEVTVTNQEYHYVLGMHVKDVPQVWYLMGSSFNFRKALGPEAGYALELNVRAFVRRLAAFCPEARRDAFFEALVAARELPPPINTLMIFLRDVCGAR